METPLSIVCVSSCIAGFVARSICHPIDTIKAQLQVKHGKIITEKLTLRGLYSGFLAVAIGGTPATCLYLTSYEVSKNYLAAKQFLPSSLVHFSAGMIAETVACTIFVPVDVVKERMQVQSSASSSTNIIKGNQRMRYNNSWHCFQKILAEEKLRGIYKGYGATLVSFGPFSAIYFTVYESCKEIMNERKNKMLPPNVRNQQEELSPLVTLCCASTAGAVAAWLTSPLDMAKLRMQIERSNKSVPQNNANIFLRLVNIFHSEGLTALWRGSVARVAFTIPNTAITMVVFEQCRSCFQQ